MSLTLDSQHRASSVRRAPSRFQPYLQVGATVILLILMLVVGGLLYPNFTSGQGLMDLFNKNAFLIPLAIGMTFVILSGGIDLSVGAVMAFASVLAAILLQDGWPAWAVIIIVLAAGSFVGLIVGFVITRFNIQPFIATLAAMFLARGLCFVLTDRSISIDNDFFSRMNLAHINLWETTTYNSRGRARVSDVYITPAVVIALVLLVAAFLVLHYTRFGRTVYAIGGSEPSAKLMGLAVPRTKTMVYVISGFCSAVAGMLFAFYTASADPVAGIGYELNAIAAVVIGGSLLSGGSGFVLGSLLGVLTLGVIYAYKEFDGDLNTGWTRVMIGVLVLFFIVLQRIIAIRRR
jgi:galactofuranose transport system permease protein